MRRIWVVLLAAAALVAAAATSASAAIPVPTVMAATGDSITRGFDATWLGCLLADCPQYSWSTGTSSSVNSDYARLKARNSALTAANDAKTGAKMADLAGQLTTAAGQKADYVTVLMGANDVCTSSAATMTDPALFRSQFQSALDGYFATAPAGAHVLVGSIPNVYQLWSLLHTKASGTWKTFGICQSMLASTNTEAQRQAVVTREAALNAALADVCTAQPTGRCRWDGYATYNTAFTTSDVSTVDYFHPSVSGQKKLAGVEWTAGYWA